MKFLSPTFSACAVTLALLSTPVNSGTWEQFWGVKAPEDIVTWSAIHRHINHTYAYAEDQELFGQHDVWQTPLQFQLNGAGDCEDFAFTKFVEFTNSGAKDVLISYVQLRTSHGPVAHMVTLVLSEGRWWVFDNTRDVVVPLEHRDDLTLVYSFDREQIYLPQDLSEKGLVLDQVPFPPSMAERVRRVLGSAS